MPTFTKPIVKPGRYKVNSIQPDGSVKRVDADITPAMIKHWVDTFAAMRKVGINIPAPLHHDRKAVPTTDADKAVLDELTARNEVGSFRNAGWWENLFQDENGTLHGVLDVPLAADAEKIGTTVKEVSLHAMNEYVAGTGEKFENPIYHIALVTHPIEPGQENFKPIQPGETVTAIAMSDFVEPLPTITMADANGNPRLASLTIEENDYGYSTITMRVANAPSFLDSARSLINRLTNNQETYLNRIAMSDEIIMSEADGKSMCGEAVKVLAELGIKLPDDTTVKNLAERIVTAGKALIAAKEETEPDGNGDGTTTPKKVTKGNIRMAQHAIDATTPQGKAIVSMVGKQIADRCSALVNSGRITGEFFEAELKPQIETLTMSVMVDDDGNPLPTSMETTLRALEAIPAKVALTGQEISRDDAKKTVTVGGVAMSMLDPPKHEVTQLTDADAEKIVDQVFANTGVRRKPVAAS